MFQYLGLSELSLQELQGLSVPLLTVLQGGQLLLHLPLQHNKLQVSNQGLELNVREQQNTNELPQQIFFKTLTVPYQ